MTQAVKTTDSSDSELVTRSLAGNRDAFGGIVARYQSLLCSLAYSAGSLSQSEDLAQETFVAAWKQLADLREPEKLRSWLCRISRNLTYDALRRQGREPIHKAQPLEEIQESPAPEPLPSDFTISREEEAILWRSIERIPENYREPLVLYYREHQSVESGGSGRADTVNSACLADESCFEQVLALWKGRWSRQSGKHSRLACSRPALLFQPNRAVGVAAKGSATAKRPPQADCSARSLPLRSVFGNYIGYRIGMDGAQSDYERDHIRRFYRMLTACILGFFAAYCPLVIWGKQFIRQRHLVFTSLIFGLVLPFTFMIFASGIYWLRGPRKFLAELAEKGITVATARPAWEYRSKLVLLGLPFIHFRVSGSLTVPVRPVKAWIAAAIMLWACCSLLATSRLRQSALGH
jgi:RNA polymerase sigma factor (sigma-70 family)